jgi:hypothetical protein
VPQLALGSAQSAAIAREPARVLRERAPELAGGGLLQAPPVDDYRLLGRPGRPHISSAPFYQGPAVTIRDPTDAGAAEPYISSGATLRSINSRPYETVWLC